MTKKPNTAILLFSRTADEEAGAKVFSQNLNKRKNALIAKRLIQHSHSVAKKSGLPVFPHFSTKQIGNNFGERLANAMEAVFEKGFENVIVIGNDCPALTPNVLKEVYVRLQNEKLILGPANDGGVYLIGIKHSAYNQDKFISLSWEQSNLQNSFEEYSREIVWLRKLSDIDHAEGFILFFKSLPEFSRLKKDFAKIIASLCRLVFRFLNIIPTSWLYSNRPLRAPPL